MKRGIFIFLGILLLLTCCVSEVSKHDRFSIRVLCLCDGYGYEGRNGNDYIKLWVNDSLLFSGAYLNRFNDVTLDYFDDYLGMEVATIDKKEDSIKIRIRMISLDSVLFYNDRHAVDTTFTYRIDNIPDIIISGARYYNEFAIFDTLRTPDMYIFEY